MKAKEVLFQIESIEKYRPMNEKDMMIAMLSLCSSYQKYHETNGNKYSDDYQETIDAINGIMKRIRAHLSILIRGKSNELPKEKYSQ